MNCPFTLTSIQQQLVSGDAQLHNLYKPCNVSLDSSSTNLMTVMIACMAHVHIHRAGVSTRPPWHWVIVICGVGEVGSAEWGVRSVEYWIPATTRERALKGRG